MHRVLCAVHCSLWEWNFIDISGCIDFRTSVTLVAFETVLFVIVCGDFFSHTLVLIFTLVSWLTILTFCRRSYFFNFSTPCI